MIDNRTLKLNLPLPNADNFLDEDVVRIANALTAIDSSIGNANGITPLDSGGKVPSAYLPAYVDDVLEFTNLASFPALGSASIIYVALDSDKTWRWGGSAYTEISASPGSTDAVPEGAVNLYFSVSRVLASVLSGISLATNAAVSASDTVLSAFGKLQKQITDLISSVNGKQATLASGTNLKTVNGVSLLGAGDMAIATGLVKVEVIGTTQAASAGNDYWALNASETTLTAPTASDGAEFAFTPCNGITTNSIDFGATTVRGPAGTATGVVTLTLGARMNCKYSSTLAQWVML